MYIVPAKKICLDLLVQSMRRAASRALASAGNNMAAKIAIIAITTSSSINVKRAELALENDFAFHHRCAPFLGQAGLS